MSNIQPTATIVASSTAGELICAAASRISTTQGTALSILERSKEKTNNATLIEKVVASGHRSVIEHATFTIAFDCVSVLVEQFVIEFRLASFTVQSRRYVDFSDVGFYVPPMDARYELRYRNNMKNLFHTYAALLELGIPKEDARFVLPYCFYSNFYCTLNARELMHMISAMIWGRGRVLPELVQIGNSLKRQFEQFFPNLFDEISHDNSLFSSDCSHFSSFQSFAFPKPTVTHSDVQLLVSTQEPEQIVRDIANCADGFSKDADNEINIGDLINSDRPRALEFLSAAFRIKNISLAAVTHVVRHRMQSIVIPPVWTALRRNYMILPESIANCDEAKTAYMRAFETNTQQLQALLKEGLPVECVPYFTLSGNVIDITCSMNGRELQHFFALRTCRRAQWEVQAIATNLLVELRKIAPSFYRFFGPGCYTRGKCPEGRLSCGGAEEVRKIFQENAVES